MHRCRKIKGQQIAAQCSLLVSELFLPHAERSGVVQTHSPGHMVERWRSVLDNQPVQLTLKLYGAPHVRIADGVSKPVTGARSIGLIALLATGGAMQRSRAFLIDLLWTDNPPDRARANLRQLLHSLRGNFGDGFDQIFDISRGHVGLRPNCVNLLGGSADGPFLEGLDLAQEGFEDWLRAKRLEQPESAVPVVQTLPSARSIHPRIMVLPFSETTLSPASGLGDALAQDLTGHFARSQLIDAISHFSSRAIQSGAHQDTNCDFTLTGQCRLSNDTLIVDASLVDQSDGKVLWSDRYKASLKDFLAGEDILGHLITGQALRVIMSGSIGESSTKPLPELESHTLMISAVALMHSFERSHFHRAEEQLNEVIYRCPEHSAPRAWLAQWHLLRVYQKWSDDPAKDSIKAQSSIKNALDLNASCPLALSIDGNIRTIFSADFATAQQRFDAAYAINPSSAFSTQLAAVLATFNGDGQGAVALTDRAFLLSPRDPRRPFFQTLSAGSYVAGGRYSEAVEMAEASLRHNPLHLSAHRCRVIGLQMAGREAEARRAATELMRIDPDLRVSAYQRDHPAAQTAVIQSWANALKEAGVPVN